MILKDVFPEVFRPKNLNEIILPRRIKTLVNNYVAKGTMQNLIFYSSGAGYGKTSLASILAKELKVPYMFIKGSVDTGVDQVRRIVEKIQIPASLNVFGDEDLDSVEKNFQVIVIIDEFEQMSPQAQKALKNILESHSNIARFIFTTNHLHKVDSALISRCRVVSFAFSKEEKSEMYMDVFKLVKRVCDHPGVNVALDKEKLSVIKELIARTFPSMRDMLVVLESMITSHGDITLEALRDALPAVSIDEYFEHLKNRDYSKLLRWVESHTHLIDGIFYDTLMARVTEEITDFSNTNPGYNGLQEFHQIIGQYGMYHTSCISIIVHIMSLSTFIMGQGYMNLKDIVHD